MTEVRLDEAGLEARLVSSRTLATGSKGQGGDGICIAPRRDKARGRLHRR